MSEDSESMLKLPSYDDKISNYTETSVKVIGRLNDNDAQSESNHHSERQLHKWDKINNDDIQSQTKPFKVKSNNKISNKGSSSYNGSQYSSTSIKRISSKKSGKSSSNIDSRSQMSYTTIKRIEDFSDKELNPSSNIRDHKIDESAEHYLINSSDDENLENDH